MSSPLEDYLETVYLLVQEHGFARVRDIARARDVKAATVSVALRKLADAGLADYERREYTRLTPKGERAARRILARHRLLTRFFEEVLRMSPEAAGQQACAMEHSLTDEAADRLARFFEFLGSCPSVAETFRRCPLGVPAAGDVPAAATAECARCGAGPRRSGRASPTSPRARAGRWCRSPPPARCASACSTWASCPETEIALERVGPGGDPLWIRCQGARLALRRSEAARIRIREPDA